MIQPCLTVPLYDPSNTVPLPVNYDGEANPPYKPNNPTNPTATARPLAFTSPPNTAIAPNKRRVKYTVDLWSPGSGTIIPDANNIQNTYPNVQRAFVRVSWKNTINADGTINLGTKAGGKYTANAGGVNDPANSRIYAVDLSQPGWIHLGPSNASPASFPFGGDSDQIVVTLYSVTPDNPLDTNLYNFNALVTADACRFTEQDVPGIFNDPLNPPAATALGPLNNPLNTLTTDPSLQPAIPSVVGTEFIAQAGRFLGPMAGFNKALPNDVGLYGILPDETRPLRPDGATLWYCVREEVVNNQARNPNDPTLPVSTTNLQIIDPAATATAPVFYCLSATSATLVSAGDLGTTPQVFEASKLRVRWRYVGYPDNGSATAFTSPDDGECART